MKRNTILAAATALIASSGTAMAIDTDPGDYVPLPKGTKAFLGYFQHLRSETFSLGGTEVPSSEATANVAIARGLYYTEAFGRPAGLQFFLPYADFSTADVGGTALTNNSGIGDLTFGATTWLKAAAPDDLTGTTLGFTLYASLPTGDYTVGGANVGNGGFTITPQVGLIQGLGKGWFLDATYDVAFTSDFDDDAGTPVEIDPKHQLQIYARKQVSPATYFAVGYNEIRGGEIFAGGASTGLESNTRQVRLSAGTFINQTTQLSGRVTWDLDTDDGFSPEPQVQFRILKLF